METRKKGPFRLGGASVIPLLVAILFQAGSFSQDVFKGYAALAASAPLPPSSLKVNWDNNLLSVKAMDVELVDLFKVIGAYAMVPMEVDPGLRSKVSVEFKNMKLDEGIKKILEAAGGKNIAVEYTRKPGAGKDEFKIEKISILRKAKEPTEAEILTAMQKRDREYRELFEKMDKEKNKIAKALKEYSDPETNHDKKIKLQTYLRQTPIEKPEDKLLLKGAIIDPQYMEIQGDLQMALLHAMQDKPEEKDKDYIVELLKRRDNSVGWLYYAMLTIWDERFLPFLLEGASKTPRSRLQIELLGRLRIKEAVPILEEALKDDNSIIKGEAWDALLQITGKKYEIRK